MRSVPLTCALVPGAPILVDGLSGGTRVATEARQAVNECISDIVVSGAESVVVVAESTVAGRFDHSAALKLRRFGGLDSTFPAESVREGSERTLPPALAVGAAHLRQGGWRGPVEFMAIHPETPAEVVAGMGESIALRAEAPALLLVGNGSACCDAGAPGSFHRESALFNGALVEMIRSGDLSAMLSLTPAEAAVQLSDVRPPLQVLAGAARGSGWKTRNCRQSTFGGVFYLCASVSLERRH